MKIRDMKLFMDGKHDADLLSQAILAFEAENVLQCLLKAHLLIERALTSRIRSKLARPDILDRGWTFSQKLSLYEGLYDPPKDQVQILRGINRARNAIAHELGDENAAVAKYLPWLGEGPRPDALSLVRAMSGLMLFELGALKSIEMQEPKSN